MTPPAARGLRLLAAAPALACLALAGPARGAPPPGPAASSSLGPSRAVIESAGPLVWNRAVESDRALAHVVPRWAAVRVVDPLGNESLYVFPSRAPAPVLLASTPRTDRASRALRMFPGYRWLVLESPDSLPEGELPRAGSPWRSIRVHAANGGAVLSGRAYGAPAPLGRDFVLWPTRSAGEGDTTTLRLRRLPSGEDRHVWVAAAGYGGASPLENFLALNLAGFLDPATGIRQDLLLLLDLEGTVLWTRPLAADHRDFAVSNFGDVAIARERMLHVFDRAGSVRFHAAIPLNVVGRTAMSPDGRYVLAASSSPGGPRGPEEIWVALFDTRRKAAPLWARRDFPERRGGDVTECSVSDDGARVLLRFSTGAVALLARDGSTAATWELPRASGGEYQRGTVPRRTWLSPDGSLVSFTTPVAGSLADARGSLHLVPRVRR